MGAPFWSTSKRGFEGSTYATNQFDRVRLKGIIVPGLCKLKALPTQDISREKAPGRDGGVIIMQGYLPGPIDLEVMLWTPDQWEVWHNLMTEIWRKPGKISAGFSERGVKFSTANAKKRSEQSQISNAAALAEDQAIEISSPLLDDHNIKRVVVAGISIPERGPVAQSWVINVKLQEFVPPPAKSTTTRVKGTNDKPTDVNDLYKNTPKNAPGKSPGQSEGGPLGPPKAPAAGGV